MGFDTSNKGDDVLQSSDVDHQQTTNRTHNTDSLTPASIDVDDLTVTNSTDATGLALSGDPDNPTIPYRWSGTDAAVEVHVNDQTVAGDNTATTIADVTDTGLKGVHVFIIGDQQGGSNNFVQKVLVSQGFNITTAERTQQGGQTISFSVSGGDLQVAIDDSGATYDISVLVIGGGSA